jgi:ribosomal protein L31E
MTSNINLKANKAFKLNKGFYKHYNKKGHIKLKCFIKYIKLRKLYNKNNKNKNKRNKDNFKSFNNKDIKNESSKVIISALINNTIKGNFNYKLVLNSSTIKHYITIKE